MKHYAIKSIVILLLASGLTACENTTVKAVNDFCYHAQPIHGGKGVPVEVQAEIDAHNAVYDAECEDMLDEMEDDALNGMTSF